MHRPDHREAEGELADYLGRLRVAAEVKSAMAERLVVGDPDTAAETLAGDLTPGSTG